jgi:outer membrane receptor protein involved in Fe transport
LSNRIFNGSLFKYDAWDGNLIPTDIDNIDLRWETFQEGGQLISVSPFYKRFANPIELVRIPEQQTSTEYQPRNVGDGQLYGVELELRKNLNGISEKLGNLSFSANVTYVYSSIDMTDVEFNARKSYEKKGESIKNTRAMAGQAPYVINGGLTYRDDDKKINAGLFYNVKGPTLFIVGGGLFPDIYTNPFHSMNVSFNKRFGQEARNGIDITLVNLLDGVVKDYYSSYKANDEVFTKYKPGRSISIGFSHRFR